MEFFSFLSLGDIQISFFKIAFAHIILTLESLPFYFSL